MALHLTEAVWQLAEDGSIFVVQDAERAGHALHTFFVDDLDSVVSEIGFGGGPG